MESQRSRIIRRVNWAGVCKSAVAMALCVVPPQVADAAGNAVVAVTATVLSKSQCKFEGSSTPALAFGGINPSSDTNATTTATLRIICRGSANPATYALTHDSGLYESGVNQNRMKHLALNEYLSYAFTLSPSSGTIPKNVIQPITVTGTVTPANFQDAALGAYADTVVVTLSP